ncbi:MAG TPA: HEAT repeat domain-containing protein, partial [Aggregicoccus sp.]|nr:HEAT repeat domain-containing protein [Aggregicoccus sp.]
VHLRANAARALGRTGSRAQAPLLLARVTDSREPLRVRQEAALALSQVGRVQQVGPLARLLAQLGARKDPQTAQLRIAVVQALGGIGGGAARKALLHHARRPLPAAEQAFVRQALAQR